MCAAGKICSRIEIKLWERNALFLFGKLKSCYTVLRKMASERVNPCPIGKTKKSRNSCNIDDSKVKASVGNEQISDSKSKSDRGSCVRSKSAGHWTRGSRDSSEGKLFSWGKVPGYRRSLGKILTVL